MLTMEQVRAKIQRNFPTQAQSDRRSEALVWNRETGVTIVSSCGTYRISKMEDPTNKGIFGYALSLAPTPSSNAKHLYGPVVLSKDCRDAAERHRQGLPLQADLA